MTQQARMRVTPGMLGRHVFLPSAIGVVDARVQNRFASTHFKLIMCEAIEQQDRVVIMLPPSNRIEISKDRNHFRLPTPPVIACESIKLVVEAELSRLRNGHKFEFPVVAL